MPTIRPVRLSVMLIALGLGALGNGAPAAETAPAKLAIVDVGTREEVQPGFVELVTAAISTDPGIAVLERKEINRLLSEQALALGIRGVVESHAAVKAGQTWGTDAFLMLEAQSNSVLRVRLVDTRYGVVLWDSAFILDPTAHELTQQAEAIATRTRQKLPLLQRSLETVCAVSVAAIQCEEISRRFDWMADRLATGIEQQLVVLPEMLLLERRSTRSLTEERTLVDGLPESLRAAVILVEGDFKISRAKEIETVMLTVRGRRRQTVVFEERMTGAAKELDQLCQQAARVIAEKAGVAAPALSMDPASEAQLLIAESRGCERVGEPLRALGLMEAAYVLQPQNMTNAVHVLELLTRTSRLTASNETATFATADYGLNIVDRLLRDPNYYAQPKMPMRMYESDCEINYALRRYVTAWKSRAEAAVELDTTFWDLIARAGKIELHHNTWAYNSFVKLERDLAGVQRTPEAALRQMGAAWKDAVSFFEMVPDGFIGSWKSLVPASPFTGEHWQSVTGLERAYLWFLEEKSKDQDPLLRYGAELALLEEFTGRTGRNARPVVDAAKAGEHLEKVAALLETHIIPRYGGSLRSAHQVLSPMVYRPLELRFADDPVEDQAIKLRYGCRVLDAALKTGQGLAACAFLKVITEMVPLLQQAGQTDRAVDYLARTLTLCGDMPYQEVLNAKTLLERLQPGHPLAAGAHLEVLQPPAHMRLCFALKSMGNDWLVKEHARLEQISQTETGWAILFSAGSQIGILELTPQFSATREQHLTVQQSANPNASWLKHHSFDRPALAIDSKNMFVGFFGGAIIRFAEGMAPVYLRDTSGQSSLSVEHLTVLNHRLYAIVDSGEGDHNALAENDVATGASTILLSSRTKDPKNALDGRPLRGLLADPVRQCLWILGGCVRDQGRPVNNLILGQYDPINGGVVPMNPPQLGDCFFGDEPGAYLARSGNVILMGGRCVCKRLDPEANVLSTTVVEGPDISRHSPPVAVGSDLVGIHKNQLIYYKADVCEPFYALDSGLTMAWPPPKRRRPRLVIDTSSLSKGLHGAQIRDLFSLGKDFLVLTDDAVWLVEMPIATDGRPLESSVKSP